MEDEEEEGVGLQASSSICVFSSCGMVAKPSSVMGFGRLAASAASAAGVALAAAAATSFRIFLDAVLLRFFAEPVPRFERVRAML